MQKPTDATEIQKIREIPKSKDSSGYDGFSTKTLKVCAPFITDTLTKY